MTRRRVTLGFAIVCAAALAVGGGALAPTAYANSPATFATVLTGDEARCLTGNPDVNCSIFTAKEAVYLNGGPTGDELHPGFYFFAVTEPGGQSHPNDGSPKLLSTDTWESRLFSVDANGTVTNLGNHAFVEGDGHGKIQVMPFKNTTNGGGEYVLSICWLGTDRDHLLYPADSKNCDSDNFKVVEDGAVIHYVDPPTISKTTAGVYTKTWEWQIEKSAGVTAPVTVLPVDGYTAHYTVTVTPTGFTRSDYQVSGTVTVNNPLDEALSDVTLTELGLSGAATAACVFDDSGAATLDVETLAPGDTEYGYTCEASDSYPGALVNTVTLSWDDQLGLTGDRVLTGGTASADVPVTYQVGTVINDRVMVTDTLDGETVPLGWASASHHGRTFTYDVLLAGKAGSCVTYTNTATIAQTGQSKSANVTVCEPLIVGGHTMGYWQNPNGQALIKGNASATGCPVGDYLGTFPPFAQDLATGASSTTNQTDVNGNGNGKGNSGNGSGNNGNGSNKAGAAYTACDTTAAWVTDVINKASAGGGVTMDAMLKGQMLATALSVQVSSVPGSYGGAGLGGAYVDLKNVNGQDVTAAFNDKDATTVKTSMTVQELLDYAASQYVPATGQWYDGQKKLQELAKNTFDAINNNLVYAR